MKIPDYFVYLPINKTNRKTIALSSNRNSRNSPNDRQINFGTFQLHLMYSPNIILLP